jgi:hypothetical protein
VLTDLGEVTKAVELDLRERSEGVAVSCEREAVEDRVVCPCCEVGVVFSGERENALRLEALDGSSLNRDHPRPRGVEVKVGRSGWGQEVVVSFTLSLGP